MITTALNTTTVRRWKCYSTFATTGVEWLSNIPAHWGTTPLKYVTQFTNGDSFNSGDWTDEGVPIIRIENLNGSENFNHTKRDADSRYHVRKGDLLFAWSGNRGTSFGPFHWEREGLHYLNQHIFRLDEFELDRRWFYWLLKGVTAYVEKQAHGIIGLVHITRQELDSIKVPIVPKAEQNAIAAFLDRETARIDTLIGHKERLISLLEEKRQAVISHAVTRGLDVSAPLEESSNDLIGLIPSHWRSIKLKYLFHFTKRQNHPGETVLSVYRDYGVIEKATRDDNHNRTPEDITSYQLVEPGDLVINKMKAWQGSLGISSLRGITSPEYVVYRRTNNEYLPYLHHLLRSRQMAKLYHSISNGIRPEQWRMEPEQFEQIMLPLPPLDEQKRIADVIDRQLTEGDGLREKIREGITRLQEYRMALISAAVTGQIDVREEVSP